MILEAAAELGIDLERSFMVGDRKSDVEAGRAAGCATVFIDLGYAEPAPEAPDYVVHSISEAADVIIETSQTCRRAMSRLTDLKVKIFADGADYDGIVKMATRDQGFTTNPTLMRKAGVTDYEAFARKVLARSRPAGVVRGLRRRLRQHGRAGARDRGVGTEREREDPVTNTKGSPRPSCCARCRRKAWCST